MFLHVSVILFTGEGGLGLCRGDFGPGGIPVPGGSILSGGVCPGSLCLGVSVQGGLCPGGLCPRRVSVQGGLCLGGALLCPGSLSWRPPRTVMSGQYASYWNAFLLRLIAQCTPKVSITNIGISHNVIVLHFFFKLILT